ncbi:MAG: exodeoxyribonuclease VII small subunit [Caldilineaceae bacterium]
MTTDAGADNPQEAISYEAAFAQLEEVLAKLESDDLSLEESLILYERGLALSTHCSTLLDTAELRVQQWQAQGVTTAFSDWQEG